MGRLGRVRRFGRQAALFAAVPALLYLLDLTSNRIVSVTPDGATVLLEGQSISAGNLTLHGWALSLDSFWGIDAAFYALAVRLDGIRTDLLHFIPALLAVLVLLAAVNLSREGREGRGAAVAAATVFILLALPSPDLAYYLLQGPWHIGTALYCLLAFRSLARDRFGWAWVLAVGVLTAGLLGDLLTLAFGILPCFLTGIAAMLRSRRWRAGAVTLSAGAVSIMFALLVRGLTMTVGTFTLVNRNIVVRLPQVDANVVHLGNRLPGLLGVGDIPLGPLTNGAKAFQFVHVVGVVVVLLGVLAAGFAIGRGIIRPAADAPATARAWRTDDLLFMAVLSDLVVFVWGSPNGHAEFAKYLTPGLIFAVVLAARMTGRVAERIRARALLQLLAGFGLAVGLAFGWEFAADIFRPAPVQSAQKLAQFLVAHHLTNGIGDYWSSSLVTVDTGGAVAVRPVSTTANDQLVRFDRQSSLDWYVNSDFDFFVFDTARPWHGVNTASATATFGPAEHTYVVGTYRVLVWQKKLSVALGAPSHGSPLKVLFG